MSTFSFLILLSSFHYLFHCLYNYFGALADLEVELQLPQILVRRVVSHDYK
jgi:hypothetical protein